MATVNRTSRIEKVRRGLLKQLANGKFPLGTKLPNEQGLAERFDVSRSSVREAVSALVSSGYLERRHGSGTYVVGRPGARHALDTTLSYTRMIGEAGMKPGQRILKVESRLSSVEEARELALEPGESVRSLERLRTADGRAVVYSIDVLPEFFVADVSNKGFNHSLYDVLDEIGLTVVNAVAVLTPVIADERMSSLLQVPVGSALQHIHEVDFTRKGEPILTSNEWHVPGVFELRVNRRRT
ncbi:MAG: GntR family transcriptional regulator [Acidimicrobiales bacterium]